jgi:hypothetical protein
MDMQLALTAAIVLGAAGYLVVAFSRPWLKPATDARNASPCGGCRACPGHKSAARTGKAACEDGR